MVLVCCTLHMAIGNFGNALPRCSPSSSLLALHRTIGKKTSSYAHPLAHSLTHIPSFLPPLLCTHTYIVTSGGSHSPPHFPPIPNHSALHSRRIALQCIAAQCSAVQEHYEYTYTGKERSWIGNETSIQQPFQAPTHFKYAKQARKQGGQGHRLLDLGINYRNAK